MESQSEKHIYLKKKVEMAVNSAIMNYNDGFLSINHVFDSSSFPATFFKMLIKKMMSACLIWEEGH